MRHARIATCLLDPGSQPLSTRPSKEGIETPRGGGDVRFVNIRSQYIGYEAQLPLKKTATPKRRTTSSIFSIMTIIGRKSNNVSWTGVITDNPDKTKIARRQQGSF